MSLEQNLQAFQQKYTSLEQQAPQGSVERHVYNQIMMCINSAQDVTPATQRAFETQIALANIAQVLDPPSKRQEVWKAVEELEQIADLPPLR
ncbi:MAG TPA: hypothetical protein VF043_33050 [Ktedonobacteraceae bacterium]